MNQRQRKKQMLKCIYNYHLYDADGGRVKAKAMVRYASSQWTIRRICMRGTTLTEICVYFTLSDERNLLAYKQDKAMALVKGYKRSRRRGGNGCLLVA
jgi:hypothetical protein